MSLSFSKVWPKKNIQETHFPVSLRCPTSSVVWVGTSLSTHLLPVSVFPELCLVCCVVDGLASHDL